MARRGPKGPVGARKPMEAKGIPPCPSMLDENARIEWRRVVKDLQKMHGAGGVDRGALVIYCMAWSDLKRLRRYLKDNGETYETNTGNPRIRPEVEIMNKAAGRLLQSAAALGMTVASRKGLMSSADKVADGNDKYLEDQRKRAAEREARAKMVGKGRA